MRYDNSAITTVRQPLLSPGGRSLIGDRAGVWWGLLGVTAFSFTVPFTRIAAESGSMSPLFIGAGRATVASILAGLLLWLVWLRGRSRSGGEFTGAASPGAASAGAASSGPASAGRTPGASSVRLPTGIQCLRLLVVAGGVVLGFPLLTSYALSQTPASHAAVVIALLPAATAAAAVIRTKERPGRGFWVMAALSAVLAVVFALVQGAEFGGLRPADLLLFAAVVAAAVGYAEGGVLSREIGSWQTISWALVLSAPVTLGLTVLAIVTVAPSGSPAQWASFAYLGVISMFLGFFAWYRGLAIGPMAQVSQVQLIQPVMSIAWAALLLGERLDWPTIVCGTAVIASAALTVRTRLRS
ncbi:DMT family transporter [Brevibacterium metallidurans]